MPQVLIESDGMGYEVNPAFMAWEQDVPCEEEALRRADVEENVVCFVTLMGPEETTLGLGLFVHKRTPRQRWYELPPDFDVLCDYLDHEAFNIGVRRGSALCSPPSGELPSMVSSSRGKLNGWFPLYINASHWSRVRPLVASAFARLAGRASRAEFRVSDCLDVCASLLCSAVVGFLKAQSERADPRTKGRGMASDRALQMYGNIHRVFLQLAWEYPELRELAAGRLRQFIHNPSARTRAKTPDLGHLVQYLCIVDEIAWEDLAPTVVPESMRRQVARNSLDGRVFDPWTFWGSNLKSLISAWDSFAPKACVVTAFCATFCRVIARPLDLSIEEVALAYDRTWGRLGVCVVEDVATACALLRAETSIGSIFPLLVLGVEAQTFKDTIEVCRAQSASGAQALSRTLGEHILWAHRHGWLNGDNEYVRAQNWPSLQGSCPLLRMYGINSQQRCHMRWQVKA